MKINLSLAAIAAVALAIAASPADAASKKKKSGKAAKVTVTKSQPYYVAGFTSCYGTAATWWFPIAAIGTVGCGIVYAVPVAIEGFLVPQGGGKA